MTKERLLRNHFLFCRKCHLSKQKENTYRIETRRVHMTRDFEHRSSSESSTKLISWKSLKATMSTTCHCAFQIRCQKGRKSRGCCWFGRLISRFLAQPKEALFILGILTFCVCFSFDRMCLSYGIICSKGTSERRLKDAKAMLECILLKTVTKREIRFTWMRLFWEERLTTLACSK